MIGHVNEFKKLTERLGLDFWVRMIPKYIFWDFVSGGCEALANRYLIHLVLLLLFV